MSAYCIRFTKSSRSITGYPNCYILRSPVGFVILDFLLWKISILIPFEFYYYIMYGVRVCAHIADTIFLESIITYKLILI